MTIDKNSRVSISPAVTLRDLGDEIVIMTDQEQEVHTLRDSGLDVWKQIGDGTTVSELLSYVITEYDVDSDIAWQDLGLFLEDCLSKGLIDVG